MTLLSTENESHSALLTIVNGLIIPENWSDAQCEQIPTIMLPSLVEH